MLDPKALLSERVRRLAAKKELKAEFTDAVVTYIVAIKSNFPQASQRELEEKARRMIWILQTTRWPGSDLTRRQAA